MSEKTMTEEREMRIMEHAAALWNEGGCVSNAQVNIKYLLDDLKRYWDPKTDDAQWRADIVGKLAAAQVFLNILELHLGDTAEAEIAVLEKLENDIKTAVSSVLDIAKEIQADLDADTAEDAAAEETTAPAEGDEATSTAEETETEPEDGIATMDEPEERVVLDGESE